MIAKLAFVLCLALGAVTDALPIDAYDGGHGYALSAAPAITYAAAPKALLAPALTVHHAAPAISYAPAPTIIKAAAPALAIAKVAEPEPYDPNPQYSFAYGVTDHHTGDSKSQEETLVDGVVHGSYSLTEADGTIRKVTYTADKIHGFNAVVEKQGVAKQAVAVAAVPAVAKVAYAAAPAITKIAYAAPALSYGGHYGH